MMTSSGRLLNRPDGKCRTDIAELKQVKNLIRPVLVMLWSGTSRPK